jgi:hypothetical protein
LTRRSTTLGCDMADDQEILKSTLRAVVDAMKVDYGEKFSRAYPDMSSLNEFKRRIFNRLKNFNPNDIADGYDEWTESERGKSFLPTLPELQECVEIAFKARKKRELDECIHHQVIEAPERPTIEIDASALLAEAMKNQKNDLTAEAREKMLAEHEALINLHRSQGKIAAPAFPQHECGVSYCRSPGTFTSSTKGAENFYCRKHYKENN